MGGPRVFAPSHIEHVDNQKPWKSINEVPPKWKYLNGARLNVEQCNEIYKEIAPRMGNNYALARIEFEKTHKMAGSVWIDNAQPAPRRVAPVNEPPVDAADGGED